jgi:AraC-like DNA-binding protein
VDNGRVGVIDESVHGWPAPPLRPYVAWYSGYRQAGVEPARHRGLPSPYLTLILTLDDPLTLAAHPDPRQAPGAFAALLGGLHTGPALVVHEGRQSGVQIALSPLGARCLLGLPAGAVAGTDVAAEDALGHDVREVRERLGEARDWPARFAVVDDWLLRRLARWSADRPGRELPPEVVRAWEVLLARGGTAGVAGLADDVGWSTRHLSARFGTEIGLSPKAAGRVIRFDRARRMLAARARIAMGAPEPIDARRHGVGDGRRRSVALTGPEPADAARTEARDPASQAAHGAVVQPAGHRPPTRGLALADLAAACGYFDQAHLDRDFRALAGVPPVAWLAEEFRNIQAGAHHGG